MSFRHRIVLFALLLLTGLVSAPVRAAAKVHEVAAGQSLWGIARRYDVSVDELRKQNGLAPGQAIQPGQKLEIPSKGQARRTSARAARSRSAAGASPCRTHVVAQGHSLWKIAKRYNVSVDAIRAQNGMSPNEPLKVGRTLEIPLRSGTCGRARSGTNTPATPETKPAKDTRVVQPPPSWTQTQKSAEDRGVNPCNTPDPGWGMYDRWSREPSMGQMISPQSGGVTRTGQFDVMFHFHGHEAVRKEWVQVMDGAVLVGIDLGIGSGPYATAFSNPTAFENLVHSVERAVAKKTGKKDARVRKVGLSAWSAGYGSVGEILNQAYGKRVVDTVVLLDGLHCGYVGNSLDERQLGPFIAFAQRAAAGQKAMFVSHSSIIPPGYASTTETANFLIHKLRGRARKVTSRGSDPMGLELISRYDRGNFHVRGYKGNDKMDHCAHIGLYRDVLRVHVKRRWRSPRGRKKAD